MNNYNDLNTNYTVRGNILTMPKGSKKNNNTYNRPMPTPVSTPPDPPPHRSNIRTKIIEIIMELFVIAIAFVCGKIVDITVFYFDTKDSDRFEALESTIHQEITELQSELSSQIDSQKKELESQLSSVEDELKEAIEHEDQRIDYLYMSNLVIYADAISSFSISKNNNYILKSPLWRDDQIIAENPILKVSFTADELKDYNLLYRYSENGEDSFFYGKFNEKYHWDGNCLINTYVNNKLVMIMDAIYDDGNLLSYKQVIPSEDGKFWFVSNRTKESQWNSGETWKYNRKDEEGTKEFEIENVTINDIYTVEKFEQIIQKNGLDGYYLGNTSNGYYNDNTGDAVLINFFEDGTVRYIYHGKIVDGETVDIDGEAWDIAKERNTAYMYFRGKFYGNRKKDMQSDHDFINPITIEEMETKLKLDNIREKVNQEIRWADE